MTKTLEKQHITKDYSKNPDIEKLVEKSLLPTNDVIFHCLFGQVGSEQITKRFIEKVLKRDIGEIDLDLNLNLQREYYDSKLGILDVRAKTPEGTNYNIEMQNTASAKLPERLLSYWSRLYTGDLKRGKDYDILAKTIAIIIVNDYIDRFEIMKKYHTKWNIREEDYKDMILTDDLEIHIIELPKYVKMKEKGESKNIWLDFLLKPEGKEVLEAMKESKEIKEAKTKWRKITSDEKIRDRALRLEIAELDRNTDLKYARKAGHDEGIKEGKEQERLEIARKMLEKGIDYETILATTGLTEEEIKKLQN